MLSLLKRGWRIRERPVRVKPAVHYGRTLPKIILAFATLATFWCMAPVLSPIALVYFFCVDIGTRYLILYRFQRLGSGSRRRRGDDAATTPSRRRRDDDDAATTTPRRHGGGADRLWGERPSSAALSTDGGEAVAATPRPRRGPNVVHRIGTRTFRITKRTASSTSSSSTTLC